MLSENSFLSPLQKKSRVFILRLCSGSYSADINSSISHAMPSKSLYISSGSCFSGMYAMTFRPLPANHPASVWAERPQGSTSTHASHDSIASISFLNWRSDKGWLRFSLYSSGVQSSHLSLTLYQWNPSSPDGGFLKS